MLKVNFNSSSQEAVANEVITQSQAANSVKLLAAVFDAIGMEQVFIERKSDQGRTYYSLPAASAQEAYQKLQEVLKPE